MRGNEPHMTINAINVNGGNFGGHFSYMKSDMKIWGALTRLISLPQPSYPPKIAPSGYIGSPLSANLYVEVNT
jgi:hypothetical protein